MKKILTYFASVKELLSAIASALYRIQYSLDYVVQQIDSVTVNNVKED